MRGYFITATDTEVGKTEVSAAIIKELRGKGYKVGVMKPVASGVKKRCGDAEIIKKASASQDSMKYIAPIVFKLPLAPLVASRLEKKKPDIKKIWNAFKKIKSNNDIIIIEGIGGIKVPICKNKRKIFYVTDLIKEMKLPVILVARPNLGTINHTLMSIDILKRNKIKIAGVMLNYSSKIKKDISVKTNPGIIEELSGIKILGIMGYNKERDKRRIKWLKKINI